MSPFFFAFTLSYFISFFLFFFFSLSSLLDSLPPLLIFTTPSIFLFPSITECLLVTEQSKVNMSTRPRREILKGCRKKAYPEVTADRQRHAVLSYPKHFTMTLCFTSRLCQGGHLHRTAYGHSLLNLSFTIKSMYPITSRCNSKCEA